MTDVAGPDWLTVVDVGLVILVLVGAIIWLVTRFRQPAPEPEADVVVGSSLQKGLDKARAKASGQKRKR